MAIAKSLLLVSPVKELSCVDVFNLYLLIYRYVLERRAENVVVV